MNMDVKKMVSTDGKVLRVAAYVRKSCEDGLEQSYNSLDCQTDAIAAYVRIQACNNWTLLDKVYSDGGYSGGNTNRPGLQSLIHDIEAGQIDIVAVYKIDRLSRSIGDFAELSKLFDEHGVSFVSVTQQIDTSTAAGRMMLSILVSFGQYEREMAADRIRDKIRASKAKGLWVGGRVPFGYKVVDKRLVPDPDNAANAVKVFELYAKYGELRRVCRELNGLGIARSQGRMWRPKSVYTCVHNIRYTGQVLAGDKLVKVDHPALITMELWNRVQKRIAEHPRHGDRGRPPTPQAALLRGLVYCGECKRSMGYGWCTKGGGSTKRYAYYECTGVRKLGADCKVRRVPSGILEHELDKVILSALTASLAYATTVARYAGIAQTKLLAALANPEKVAETFDPDEHQRLVRAVVKRIDVYESLLEVRLDLRGVKDKCLEAVGEVSEDELLARVPVTLRYVSGTRRVFRIENGKAVSATSLEENPLLASVVRAHVWMRMLDEGKVKSLPELVKRLKIDRQYMVRTLRLATLSPRIIRDILTGTEPSGLSLEKIRRVTTDDWAEQERQLGFTD